eukprot:1881345-Rhodomonas_salina.2
MLGVPSEEEGGEEERMARAAGLRSVRGESARRRDSRERSEPGCQGSIGQRKGSLRGSLRQYTQLHTCVLSIRARHALSLPMFSSSMLRREGA